VFVGYKAIATCALLIQFHCTNLINIVCDPIRQCLQISLTEFQPKFQRETSSAGQCVVSKTRLSYRANSWVKVNGQTQKFYIPASYWYIEVSVKINGMTSLKVEVCCNLEFVNLILAIHDFIRTRWTNWSVQNCTFNRNSEAFSSKICKIRYGCYFSVLKKLPGALLMRVLLSKGHALVFMQIQMATHVLHI
jgi:hypothetical protein